MNVKPQVLEEAVDYLTRYLNRRNDDLSIAFASPTGSESYARANSDVKNLERIIGEIRKTF